MLNTIKNVQEVCTIYCATANPVEVIIAETPLGRGIMGVIDGSSPAGVESPDDVRKRVDLLRKFGYKGDKEKIPAGLKRKRNGNPAWYLSNTSTFYAAV